MATETSPAPAPAPTPASEGEASHESSAESSHPSPKEFSPKDAALLETEVAALSKVLSTVSNEAARIVTRQHWRKCLIGTEKDQSFLVRAILKHSTPHVYVRAMEDHGDRMLEVASDEFLDRALEARLKTIEANDLVALLAKTKRLGYDEQDDVDEEEDVVPAQGEIVEDLEPDIEEIPNPESRDAIMVDRSDSLLEEQNRDALEAATAIAAPYHPSIPLAPLPQNMNLPTRRKARDALSRKFVCPDCTASFAQQGGLTYHMERKVCHRPAPQFRWFCKTCGKGFTTSGGKLYHEQNKVCQAHETAQATPPTSQPQPGPATTKPMSSPSLQGGLPSPGFVPRLTSLHPRPLAAAYPQTPPTSDSAQLNPSRDVPRSLPIAPANSAPSWPSQRIETLTPPAVPNYTNLRASIDSSAQKTPMGSSPATDQLPGEGPVLDAATQAELNAKLNAEIARFEQKCREIPDTLSAAERQEALDKEKRGHATRKSQIRKKYGIQIRTSKLQPANFVRVPGQGDAPILAPISRIASFKAPAANITTKYAISTPASVEQVRQRPIMENPDAKRRRLENTPPSEQNASSQARTDPYGVPGGLQRRISAQGDETNISPEVLEVDEPSKPEQPPAAPAQPSANKPPKKVQWEPVPAQDLARKSTPTPPPSLSPQRERQATPLTDISNKTKGPKAKAKDKGKTKPKNDEKLVVAESERSNSGSEAEDSDFDPDEEIPARLPVGAVRRSRATTSSTSVSPKPAPAKPAAVKRKAPAGIFSPPTRGEGEGRRASLVRAARAVVQV